MYQKRTTRGSRFHVHESAYYILAKGVARDLFTWEHRSGVGPNSLIEHGKVNWMSFSPPHSLPHCTWKKSFFHPVRIGDTETGIVRIGNLLKSDQLCIFVRVFSWVNSFEAAEYTQNNVTVNSREIPREKISLRFSECDVRAWQLS